MTSFIRALAASELLKERAVHVLAGPVEDELRDALHALAAEVGFHGLRILGEVTDGEMRECLNTAHIVCCLRQPSIEGASASVLKALQSERPTLVTEDGF